MIAVADKFICPACAANSLAEAVMYNGLTPCQEYETLKACTALNSVAVTLDPRRVRMILIPWGVRR